MLIDFQVEEYENTFPMVPPGASLQDTIDSPYEATPVKTDGRSKCRRRPECTLMPSRATHRTIVALVENKPGVLNRSPPSGASAASTSSRLTVGHWRCPALSRMTFTVDGAAHDIEQVTKQLYKVIEVVKINDITGDDMVARELALIRVNASNAHAYFDPRDRADLPRQRDRRRRRTR